MKRGSPRHRRVSVAAAFVALGCAVLAAPGARPAGSPPKVLVLGSPEPPASPPPGAVPSAAEQARAEALQGVPVAQVSFVETRVDLRPPDGEWARLAEGGRVHTGDRLRTGPESVARLEFPWMGVALAPASELTVSKGTILGLRLEAGRVELTSGRDEMIKLDTAEARLRGRGRMVVRREGGATRVSVLHGDVRVSAGGATARLAEGFGCVVERARACVPRALPAAPKELSPGADPVYVAAGAQVPLTWQAPVTGFHVQVLGFDEDVVLMQRDVARPPLPLAVPWPGLYRWRVSARGDDGLEGPPSLEGLVQVMRPEWLKAAGGAGP